MNRIFELFEKLRPKAQEPTGAADFLIVGLGNPGDKYDKTRHNAGFHALDAAAKKAGIDVCRARFKGLCGEGSFGGRRVLFLKPQTYMNASGEAVREAADFYKLSPDRILVLCDDISFDEGIIRIRRKGSAGGHNGLKSIIQQLGSDGFSRIRIGVGKMPRSDYDMVDWVLGTPASDKQPLLTQAYDKAVQAAELICEGKTEDAMCRFSN